MSTKAGTLHTDLENYRQSTGEFFGKITKDALPAADVADSLNTHIDSLAGTIDSLAATLIKEPAAS